MRAGKLPEHEFGRNWMIGYSPGCLRFYYNSKTGVAYSRLDFLGMVGYRVGDDGSIWSRVEIIHPPGKTGSKSVLGKKWKRRSASKLPNGRRMFRRNGRGGYVSHFVLKAFVGSCPAGMECCHRSGNVEDDHLTNLRWDTHSANLLDKRLVGTDNRGSRHNMAKLDEITVLDIRRRIANGERNKDIAAELGLAPTHVSDIKRRKFWKHV